MKCKTFVAALAAFTLWGQTQVQASATPALTEMKQYVNEYYYPGIDASKVKKSTSMKQLSDQLDPYSLYMTADEFSSFYNEVESKLVGIGISVSEHAKGIEILQVFNNSPAKKAGIKTNDIITKVNGQSTANVSLEEATQQLKGKKGTTVQVTLYRPSTGKTYTKTIKRAVVNIPNVETAVLSGRIGYIRLNSFASDSGEEVARAIQDMPDNIKGYIFDLRDNSGGDVSSAENIVSLSKGNKVVCLLKMKSGTYYVSTNKQKVHWDAPLAILVNKNSASASEMTAAAYKDQHTAKIYGQKTYGKGVMQQMFELSDGGFLKLTIAEFRGPQNTVIHKKGIAPTVQTTVNKELYTSHKAYLVKQLKRYTKEPNIQQSASKQTITIKPNKDMDWKTLKTARVALMQIGGKTRSVTVKALDKKLVVQSKTALPKGTSYYLRVTSKKQPSKGTYTYVTIK